MASSDSRSVNCYGHGHLVCKFPINVTVPDGEFFALDNTCTHRGGLLADGEVSGHEVTCPWHGATFDVRTGEVVGPPAQRAVVRYGVRVTRTDIEVEL